MHITARKLDEGAFLVDQTLTLFDEVVILQSLGAFPQMDSIRKWVELV